MVIKQPLGRPKTRWKYQMRENTKHISE